MLIYMFLNAMSSPVDNVFLIVHWFGRLHRLPILNQWPGTLLLNSVHDIPTVSGTCGPMIDQAVNGKSVYPGKKGQLIKVMFQEILKY